MASIRGRVKTLKLTDKTVVREWWLCSQKKWFSAVRSVPLTDILIKEVSPQAIWGWIQCSRRCTRQRRLCNQSMNNATTKYIPLTVCLSPNYCKVLSPEETKKWRIFWLRGQCDFLSVLFVFVSPLKFGTLGAEDTAGCSKLRTEKRRRRKKNSQAEAQDKVLLGRKQTGLRRREAGWINAATAPDIHCHLKNFHIVIQAFPQTEKGIM